MKYQSDLIKEIIDSGGHKKSSLHYESECVESWIEEVKGGYPKLCDYQAEWLNYINENSGIGDFPYHTLVDVTDAVVENVVPYAYKSAILSGNTLVNLAPQVEDTVIRVYYQGEYVMLTPHITPLSNLKANTKYTVIFKTSNITNAIEGMFHYQGMSTDYFSFSENIGNYTLVNGHNKLLFTTAAEFSRIQLMFYSTLSSGGSFTIHGDSIMFLEGDHTQEDIAYFEGMQSVKMPVLTTSNEDGTKTNILTVNEEVELRGIGDVKDTLDCLTGEVTERVGEIVFDGTEDWYSSMNNDGGYRFDHTIPTMHQYPTYGGNPVGEMLSNYLPVGGFTISKTYDKLITTWENRIVLYLGMDITTTKELKEYLSQNPLTVQYRLATESIKTVDLTIIDQDGNTLSKIKPIEGTMIISTDGTPIKPLLSAEIPVEATTQNLSSFIELEME